MYQLADLSTPPRFRGLAFWLALAGGFALLVLLRVLLLHSDPTDFPLDRNMTAATTLAGALGGARLIAARPEAPEFPFMAIFAWILARFHVPGIIGGRIFSLLAALLTGAGLFVMGRRLGSPRLGLIALWLFALLPLSVLMGRSLLPDTFMVAAMVWGFVAARAGRRGAGWPAAIWTLLALSIAALAKLPALVFAPAIGLALVSSIGWRRPGAWALLVVTALITYLITCGWYQLLPWNPVEGLRRISANTNNLMASLHELLDSNVLILIATRAVLALTLPGVLLALGGWLLVQWRPRPIAWFHLWLLSSVIFLAITMKANTYWAYAAVPAGCLAAALALDESLRLGRRAAPLLLLLPVMLWVDPALQRVAAYLAIHPEYRELLPMSRSNMTRGRALNFGMVPNDLIYFTERSADQAVTQAQQNQVLSQALNGNFAYFLTNRLFGEDVTEGLFRRKPILATHGYDYLLFGTNRTDFPGRPLAAKPPNIFPQGLDLDHQITLIAASAEPEHIKPGDSITLHVTFEKGAQNVSSSYLSLLWSHENTGERIPVAPQSGGVTMKLWALPWFQTPDFTQTKIATMDYQFKAPAQLPAGAYRLQAVLSADPKVAPPVAVYQHTPPLFTVDAAPAATLPVTLDPESMVWLMPRWETHPAWLGRINRRARFGSDSSLWLSPNLSRGTYTLKITGGALPNGAGTSDEGWPELRIEQPGRTRELKMRFDSRGTQTVACRFEWQGSGDFLRLSMANPHIALTNVTTFPLYIDDLSADNRSILIDRILVDQAGP